MLRTWNEIPAGGVAVGNLYFVSGARDGQYVICEWHCTESSAGKEEPGEEAEGRVISMAGERAWSEDPRARQGGRGAT